jgi:uncharacterized membrane protein YfcA
MQKTRSMNEILILLATGIAAGIFSGMVGIGGGTIIVPALVYFLGYTQYQAQGTVLFMFLFPIGILGVYNYYSAGHIGQVEAKTAMIIASTFIAGAWAGSKFAVNVDQETLKKIFGVFLLILGAKMIFWK